MKGMGVLNVFDSVLATVTGTGTLTLVDFLLCSIVSFLLGILVSLIYMYQNHYSKSFVVTLALLPAVVQVVIMMVNGNLGTGIAVMGAFSLVRFRSVPGSAREIGSIFMAMAVGLATGMGYLGIATLFLILVGMANILLYATRFGEKMTAERELKITIPENLDYSDVFNDLFQKYSKYAKLVRVKTTNMGSLYELYYHIELKDTKQEKNLIDDIRCRNGNLNIICGKPQGNTDML